MGAGEGAYSWHAYSTMSNALGAAGFFFLLSGLHILDNPFGDNAAQTIQDPGQQTKQRRTMELSGGLYFEQYNCISIPRPAPGQDMSYGLNHFSLIALIVSFGLSKQPFL